MVKCKAGDKVRITSHNVNEECKFLKVGDIVEIKEVSVDFEYFVSGYAFNITGEDYYLYEDEFELVNESVESDKKYIWYLDGEKYTYFLNNILGVEKWCSHETEEIKNGKDACYLLTEEEAKQSPFFDKFAKHDPFEEKWYYIRMKGNDDDYLNLNFDDDSYFMDDEDERGFYKVKFTEEECNEIIGTSSILYKELVE